MKQLLLLSRREIHVGINQQQETLAKVRSGIHQLYKDIITDHFLSPYNILILQENTRYGANQGKKIITDLRNDVQAIYLPITVLPAGLWIKFQVEVSNL